ncbi:2-hydroxyacyl-CoA dehydratase [Mesorhizobium microcysteis]|uniref:2-hydroxyacyl-CoA dehydratase n=1 Tax=Neoaquamicrobium microcysteis TaxID=2682781 RepID=A0A5D4GZR6_9HYPH|nr:2-hydroxyacyl-CoA dehydratase family protein [Mesorhizobium microcysteis]TYR33542.1 2-hydroxyacyl-CoA dehydratase [Mesorhizobium microcysteis]
MHPALGVLAEAARRPNDHARRWKAKTGRKVVGSFPMHFPAEVVHASGAMPVVLQESDDPITVGGAGMYPFFCGYTRSVVDQASKGDFDYVDAIMFGDHCVQILSAADIVRNRLPETQVGFYQLIPSLRDKWSLENSMRALDRLIEGIEETLGVTITEDDLRASIREFNENRQLIRRLYELRRTGAIRLRASHMQHIVKSSMVMDKAEHNALLRQIVDSVEPGADTLGGGLPVYVSGHLCQAPKPAVLDMIEDCGAVIVDDDLYHGYRYISMDMDETGDPVKAIANWYLNRNFGAPCPTRLDPGIDWDGWLLKAVDACGAKGMIVLMAKFCEPHYFYYPRIRKAFQVADVPHLLIETEHEMLGLENMRTKVETFVEVARRRGTPQRIAS